jgi:hypothetical protein
MAKEKAEILHIRVDADFWDKIDAWRATQGTWPPNRSDAVRYLIDYAITSLSETAGRPPASQTKPRQPQKSRPK